MGYMLLGVYVAGFVRGVWVVSVFLSHLFKMDPRNRGVTQKQVALAGVALGSFAILLGALWFLWFWDFRVFFASGDRTRAQAERLLREG